MSNKITIHCYDVDNTIFDGYTQKYFVNYLFVNKIFGFRVKFLSAVWFFFYNIGLVGNLHKPMNYLLSFLNGLNLEEYNDFFDKFFIKCIKNNIYPEAAKQIKEDIDNGVLVVLISTSLEPIIIRIARYLGIKEIISTKVLFNEQICRGVVSGKIVDGKEKVNFLVDYINSRGLSRDGVRISFYTDSHRDLDLLNFVDIPNVVNPDNKLFKLAKLNHWPIFYFH